MIKDSFKFQSSGSNCADCTNDVLIKSTPFFYPTKSNKYKDKRIFY